MVAPARATNFASLVIVEAKVEVVRSFVVGSAQTFLTLEIESKRTLGSVSK